MLGILFSLFLASSAGAVDIRINIGAPATGSGLGSDPLASQFIPSLNSSNPTGVGIWAMDVSTKILQDVGSPGSTTTFKVSGLRGEWVGFQYFIQAPAGGLSNLNTWMTNLVNAQTNETISTQTATSAKNGWLSAEYYTNVTTRSVNIAIGPGYIDALKHFVPDALVPIRDPYYNQITNAFPMTVAAGKNQGFWGKVLIPTGISSGYYKFTVNLTTGTTLIGSMDGYLAVIDSTMPATSVQPFYIGYDTNGMCQQQYGGSSGCHAYNPTICGTNDAACQELTQHDAAVMGLDHRMSVGNLENWSISSVQTQFGHLITGTNSGSFINTITPGAKFTSIRESLDDTNNTTAANWVNTFIANYSTTTLMPYAQACDEPGANWSGCLTTMNDLAASKIPFLVTDNYNDMKVAGASGTVNDLANIVEDANNATNKANMLAWVAVAPSTRSAGQYDDCVSGPCSGVGGTGFPNKHIDGRPINNMALPFTVAQDTYTFTFHSDTTLCWISACGANPTANPWAVGGMLLAQGSHNTTASDGQGDETLFWPGTTAQVATSTPIFLSSIRAELVLAGEQWGPEYKAILKANGLDSVYWTQQKKWYTDEQTFNEDPINATGGFTGTITSAHKNEQCAIHQIKWPTSTCPWGNTN